MPHKLRYFIPAGIGFKTGSAFQDFYRLDAEQEIQEATRNGLNVTGFISGDMNSKCGFMRRDKVQVSVQARHVITRE